MYIPDAVRQGASVVAREAGFAAQELVTRQYYTTRCNGRTYNYQRNCRSTWSRIGRWILAGVLVFLGLIFLLVFLCCMRRRKRRANKYATQAPMSSTTPVNSGYGNNHNNQYAPPPGAPPTYGGANDGYYGQQGGVTQPQGAHYK